MTDELIVFTHNDYDALGCMLSIEYKFPDIKKKYFHTNYANIPQIVADIEQHIKENGNKHILIPDVSFSDNKEHLRTLYNLGNCIHIDHHLYPDGFWDEFPDMKVVWDKTKCASKLCHEYFGNVGKNPALDKMIEIVDVYDLWQVKHPLFDVSQDVNRYIWTYDLGVLCDKIVANDYKLPDDYKEVTTNIRETFTKEIAEYEERGLIHRAGDITFAFVKSWFNEIMIPEMDSGKNVVVGINPYGITRVRINQDSDFTKDQLDNLRMKLTGTKDIGHNHAFTYRIDKKTVTMDDIFNEAKKIVAAIEEVRC